MSGFLQSIEDQILSLFALVGIALGAARSAAIASLNAIQQQVWRTDPNQKLSPSDAATATVKNIPTSLDLASEALAAGVDGEHFAALVNLTGNPPGPETLLDMLNRGVIPEDLAVQGMKEGYLKDEWIPYELDVRYNLLTPGQVIEAQLQGAPGPFDWRDLYAKAGADPTFFDTATWITGNPPGPMQLIELFNRRYIDMPTLVQGLSESRLKDKWIPAFLNLANTQIPVREVIDAVKAGAVDQATAEKLFTNLGYSPDLAAILIRSGAKATATAHKELSLSMVKGLYEDRIITGAQATADLLLLGYSADDAALYLSLLDKGVQQKFVNLAISKVRAGFTGRKITAAQASTDLDTLQVPTAQRDQLLQLWGLEMQANPKELTLGQLDQAFKYQIFTLAEFVQRVEGLGYTQADAQTLAAIVNKGPLAP